MRYRGRRRQVAFNKRRNRLATVVVAALIAPLTVTVGGPVGAMDSAGSGTWAAPDWAYSPEEPIADGDIDARAVGESVTRDEAERRLRADRAASHVQDVAQERWPDTFAGLWIDHDPYRVNVAFTRDAAANVADLRAEFPYPDDLRAVDARHSLEALTLLQERLATERSSLQQSRDVPGMPDAIRATRGGYDLDIDVVAGQVVVRGERPTSALRAAFAQRYPGPVVVRPGLAKPSACRPSDCRYAMMGGLKLEIGYQSSLSCSSAFTAYLTSNSSYRYVLSAGHCSEGGVSAFRLNGDEFYGEVTARRVAYEVDVERVRRDDTTPWRESSKFYVQGEAYPRLVNSVTAYSAMAKGMYLGKTGYTSGTTRGYITSRYIAPAYVPNGRNFVEADMCTAFGDSGGAVWSGNSAYGIVSGSDTRYPCRDLNGTLGTARGTTIFGALSYATAAMAVTVLSGTNLKPTADYTSSCLLLDCSFDASGSKDDDGGITSYTWNFGDGSTGSGRTTMHSYLLPGPYTVTLTTMDNNGATTSKSVGITVTAS